MRLISEGVFCLFIGLRFTISASLHSLLRHRHQHDDPAAAGPSQLDIFLLGLSIECIFTRVKILAWKVGSGIDGYRQWALTENEHREQGFDRTRRHSRDSGRQSRHTSDGSIDDLFKEHDHASK